MTDTILAVLSLQTRQHIIDGKKVEAKAAVPRNSGSGNLLTKKMFVGGTVRTMTIVCLKYLPRCHFCCNSHQTIIRMTARNAG